MHEFEIFPEVLIPQGTQAIPFFYKAAIFIASWPTKNLILSQLDVQKVNANLSSCFRPSNWTLHIRATVQRESSSNLRNLLEYKECKRFSNNDKNCKQKPAQ